MKRQFCFPLSLRSLAARLTYVLLLGCFGVLTDLTPTIRTLEQTYGLAWLFQSRGAVPAPKEIVVIALDQESARALGLPPKPDQWPRDLHARLIQQLAQAGASVIVFDLLFDNPGKLPLQDDALAAAMRAAGNVVLTESLVQEELVISGDTGRPVGQVAIEKTALPIALLANAAAGTAPFPLPKNTRVDAAWLFKRSAGSMPTLPTLALQLHARDATTALRRLLQRQDSEFAASLPVEGSAILQPGMAEKLALHLRQYFVRHPDRGQRLLQNASTERNINLNQQRQLQALLHAYLGPEARYLNFYGPPRSITTIPYYQALQGHGITATTFAGKVVFVGYSASATSGQDRIRDDYDTVFSRDDGLHLSGVEIGATALANVLDDTFVQPLEVLARLVLVFGWGSALALLCHARRTSHAAVISLLAACSYLMIAHQLFAHRLLWLPMITPLLVQLPLALFAATLWRALAAKKERLYLQNVFSHFIPPTMVQKLASRVPALGTVDSLFYGVCLATDARNYTSMAESIEPVALTNLMNRYYATLFAPVTEHGGIVSDIKGDAMLAIWSDGESTSTMRAQACRAALDIHAARTSGLSAISDISNIPMLPTRIGIDFGPLTVGNVGAGRHYEYRAVGDTVNTATRIEGLNKQLGTWVLASAAVVDGLDSFLLRAIGSFLLPGKSIPVKVVEILGDDRDLTERARQENLCRQFGDALALFQQHQWKNAEHAFSAVLCTAPDDGPSSFYVRECVRKLTADGACNDDAVIRITDK